MTTEPRVHLLSCVGAARDLSLVEPFVRHYRELGVPLSHIHLIAHAEPDAAPALAALEAHLAELGIEPAERWRGTYTSGAMWERRRALQRRTVAPGAWVLSADVDELHAYPAGLTEVVDHLEAHDLTVLQGPLLDRVAPGGVLRRVDPRRSLAEQFPIVADVMGPVGGVRSADDADGTVKMMLFRGDVLPGIGGHAPWIAKHGPWRREGVTYAAGRPLADFPEVVDAAWRFAQPAAVHHYRWTAGLAEAVRRRRDAAGASPHGSRYGNAVLAHLERHRGRIGMKDVAVAHPAPRRRARFLRRLLRTSAGPAASDPGPAQPSLVADDDWQDRLRALRDTPVPRLPDTPRKRALSDEPPRVADGWRVRRLTDGTHRARFHSHSYYDIPVLDDTRTLVAAHELRIEDRWMTPLDAVTVGVVDREAGGFEPLAETTAWSWQQGPLAQWVPGTRQLVWNHREGGDFVARLHDVDSGRTSTLPRTVYALAPDGLTALSLNMARLSRARPGYGYFGGDPRAADTAAPTDDGVWRIGLTDGSARLVLSLADAVAFLHSVLPDAARSELVSTPHLFWFNHAKVSPDGRRCTVKLRWRVASLEQPWRGSQSASLVVGLDGTDLRLLCRAASHVMWRGDEELICWDEGRERLAVLRDRAPQAELLRDLPREVFGQNVHIHPLSERPGGYLYDVPYAETVQLRAFDEDGGTDRLLAELDRHVPAHGPFRCDLHPAPTRDGDVTVFTSLHDGGRQVYVLEREA